jgi:hypothetical protein
MIGSSVTEFTRLASKTAASMESKKATIEGQRMFQTHEMILF